MSNYTQISESPPSPDRNKCETLVVNALKPSRPGSFQIKPLKNEMFCMRFGRMKWSRSYIPFILRNQGGTVTTQAYCHLRAVSPGWSGTIAGPTVMPHLPDAPLKLLWFVNEMCLNWYQCLLQFTPTLRLETWTQWKTNLPPVCPDGSWFTPAGIRLSLLPHFIPIFSSSLRVLMTSGLSQDTEIIASQRLFNQLPQIHEGKSFW